MGATGATGATGPVGPVGPAGASVETRPLPVGDPNCPWGGAELIGNDDTAYACNGAPGEHRPEGPGRFVVQLYVEGELAAVFADFDGLVARTEIIEYVEGEELWLRTRSGRHTADDVVLRRGVAVTDAIHTWHGVSVANGYPARAASLLFIDSTGSALARFELLNAWPSALLLNHTDLPEPATYLESLTLVSEHITRVVDTPGAAPTSGPVAAEYGLGDPWGTFERVYDLGATVDVIAYQDGDDPITRKRTGRVSAARTRLVRALDQSVEPWAARQRLVDELVHLADRLTIRVGEGGDVASASQLSQAWPFALRVFVGPDGRLMEEVSIAADEYARLP